MVLLTHSQKILHSVCLLYVCVYWNDLFSSGRKFLLLTRLGLLMSENYDYKSDFRSFLLCFYDPDMCLKISRIKVFAMKTYKVVLSILK